MGVLKKIGRLVERLLLVPVIVLLVVAIFALMVLGSFGRTWDVIKEASRRVKLQRSYAIPVEEVKVVPVEYLRVSGIEVPKPPTPTNLN